MKAARKITLNQEQFENILLYFSSSIHKKNNETAVYWDLAKNCIAKLGFVDCVIYAVDSKNKKLIQKAAFGPKNPKNKEIYNPVVIPLGSGISGYVAVSGVAEIIADTSKDPRYVLDDENRLSEITVPILLNGNVYGVIDCEHPKKDFFTEQHLRILKAVAAICAVKIDQIKTDAIRKKEQEKLLQVREEMVSLKIKAFRSQMNPHFVFNALNSIQYFITTNKKGQALDYLSVFGKIIRYYLKNIHLETVSLNEEITMLQQYLKLQKLRYNNNFEYTITLLKETKKQNKARIPVFVLQTLLENIVEQFAYSGHKKQILDLLFEITSKHVFVKVSFSYFDTKSRQQEPEYRKYILNWQKQIEALNLFGKYHIEKKIIFYTSGGTEEKRGDIEIKLPNLFYKKHSLNSFKPFD